MITSRRTSMFTIRNSTEYSNFSELLNLRNVPTETKDYLFNPKEFDEEWFIEWKEYIFTLSKDELMLTPADKSYDFKLLNISMLHILQVLSACTKIEDIKQICNIILEEHVENMAKACHIAIGDTEKFKANFDKFLNTYRIRKEYILNNGAEDIELNSESTAQFRGCKHHLIFGKIVGDALGLHPVLGALLNPTGGIIGPNNSNPFYRSLTILPSFKKNGMIHDATGYLRYYHGIGPGYKYLDVGDIRGRLTASNGIFYGYKLPGANLKNFLKWEAVEVKNYLKELKLEDAVNQLVEQMYIIIFMLGCFLVLSQIM
ncbi:hypothetical protein LOD99_5551 [Oopsacas minuta]|uniref:Uncharacterized protein n=1 Tax=Oopsacas minuta TaxID=111878 RepID=A0AAV7JR15_9METZ|nr:hypothetical protein LOD99_5551 [Oopsacas minuta]